MFWVWNQVSYDGEALILEFRWVGSYPFFPMTRASTFLQVAGALLLEFSPEQ